MTAPLGAQSADELKDGFVSMFNGKDFAGWRFGTGSAFDKAPKNWSVEDGLIKLHGGGSPHLASQWDYEDFDMRFQWKALKKGYNGGFFVRSGRNVGSNQINLAEKAAGNLMGRKEKDGPGVPELQKPPGEWNEWRVLAQGDKLTFWCNGKQAWEVTGFKPARGYIGQQAEGAAIDFKNLRIKELGYQQLNSPKHWEEITGWRPDGDGFSGAGKMHTAATFADYTLRLEWKTAKDAKLTIQAGGVALATDHAEVQKTSNPADQWNYLEIRALKDKVTLWQNGTALKDAPPRVGGNPTRLTLAGEASVRNMRIRKD
jgi:hypothetical protein